MNITILNILILLAIAASCAWLAQRIVGYSHKVLIRSIALGFIGALLGPWIASSLSLPVGYSMSVQGASFPVLWSIIGAILFVAISIVSRRRGLYA